MKHLISGLLLAGATAFMPVSHAQDRLDLSVPEDALEVQRKFLCSRTEGDVTYGYFEGKMYSRVEGERDRILFNLVGVNVRQCKDLMDPERGKGFRSVSREVMLYLDPETNEVLRTWENPWTGEAVDVIHVANDPVNMRRPIHVYREDGSPIEFNGLFKNGRVITSFNIPLFYKNPLGGEYQDYVGGTYHAMEMFNNYAYEDEVLDRNNMKLSRYSYSWTRVADWLPWMKMGDRLGVMFTSVIGARVNTVDDIPEPLLSEMRANYPKFLTPPPLDDDRPNETTWVITKAAIDAARGDN